MPITRVVFIAPADYATFGLPAGTSVVQVADATSAIEEAILRPVAVAAYTETIAFQEDRNTARLGYGPVISLTSARGRLIANTRGTPLNQIFPEQHLFVSPGTWFDVDTASIEVNAATGDIWVPRLAGLMSYNELEVTYQGGWATVPLKLQEAVALLVKRMCLRPSPDITRLSLDDIATDYQTADYIDEEIRRKIQPYVARSW